MALTDGQAVIYRGSQTLMLGMLFRVRSTSWPYANRYDIDYWDDPTSGPVLRRVRESSLRPVDPDQVVAVRCDRHAFWHVPAGSEEEGCPSCAAGLCGHHLPPAICLRCRT